MVSVTERLKAKAIRRTAEVQLDGETFTVIEVDADSFAEYGTILKKDRKEATAFLLSRCVLDEEGNPAVPIEDAREISKSTRVTVPLMNRIMELSGFGDDEKKADAD